MTNLYYYQVLQMAGLFLRYDDLFPVDLQDKILFELGTPNFNNDFE
jgi:hypothetical protein